VSFSASLPENGKLPAGVDPSKAPFRIEHVGGGPSEGRPCIPPPLHVSADPPSDADHGFDDVGACRVPSQLRWQAEPRHRQDLVHPLKDRPGDIGYLVLEPFREVARPALDLLRIVHPPHLFRNLLHGDRMYRSGPLGDVLDLVDLAALDGMSAPKVSRIALPDAFAPSTMKRTQPSRSRQRSMTSVPTAWSPEPTALGESNAALGRSFNIRREIPQFVLEHS